MKVKAYLINKNKRRLPKNIGKRRRNNEAILILFVVRSQSINPSTNQSINQSTFIMTKDSTKYKMDNEINIYLRCFYISEPGECATALVVVLHRERLKTRELKTRHGQKHRGGKHGSGKRGTRMHAFFLMFIKCLTVRESSIL